MKMSKWLGSQRFGHDGELNNAMTSWLLLGTTVFYAEGSSKLVKHYNECLNFKNSYAKNLVKVNVEK